MLFWVHLQKKGFRNVLLVVEEAIHKILVGIYHPEIVPFQFNQSWLALRIRRSKGLIQVNI